MSDCKKHPKYEGKEKPRANCEECWRIYFESHSNESDKFKGRPIRINRKELIPQKEHKAKVVFIGDCHIGSPQCDIKRLERMIKYCAEKNVYVFCMGDIIEVATKTSVGAGVYEQSKPAEGQIQDAIDLFTPLIRKNLIIGFLTGNHEFRAYKESGVNVANFLAKEFGTKNLGYACWNVFRVEKTSYSVYAWHGVSSARFTYTKTKALFDTARSFRSDAFVMGHVHDCVNTLGLEQYVDIRDRVVKEHKQVLIISGHYLSYDGGYAQMRGYSIPKLGSPKVEFDGEKKDIHCSW